MSGILRRVRERHPLVHCITNYVTAGDCANMLLACGASPIMADAPEEAAAVAARSAGLCLNLGTLHRQTIPAMLAAGQAANARGIPVVLDPVGAGFTAFRTETAQHLLTALDCTVLRGNFSEIRALFCGDPSACGVDADAEPAPEEAAALAVSLARRTGAIVSLSGAVDVVTDGERTYRIRNGHPILRQITGTGCMLSALTAAFTAAQPEDPLTAAAAAAVAMGLCGESAHSRMQVQDGNAACRSYLIDAMFHMTDARLQGGVQYAVQ